MAHGAKLVRALGWSVAASLFTGTAIAPIAAADDGDIPLPLTGRQTVRAGQRRYVIDGKQTIPAGSVIRVEASVRIVGVNQASLEIKGGLQVHGISGSRVRIENVDFSPTVAPDNDVHFDMADLSGCTISHAEGAAFTGNLTMENSSFGGGAFSVRMRSGFLRVMSVKFTTACAIACVPDKGRPPEIAVRNCTLSGFTLSGDMIGTVRESEMKGPFEAKDFTTLRIDACDLDGGITLRQGPEGTFAGLKLVNCNLPDGAKIVLHRPTAPKTTMEKVRIEKFFFGRSDGKADLTDKQIADRIDDGADDANISVKAVWSDPKKSAH